MFALFLEVLGKSSFLVLLSSGWLLFSLGLEVYPSYHGLHNVTVHVFDAHRKLSFFAYFNIPVIQHAYAHIPCLEL